MIFETACVGALETNCYILGTEPGHKAIIIDPGDEEDKIKNILGRHKLKPAFIVNTHGHIDHIGCDDKFGVPVYIHKKDAALIRSPELNLSSFLASSFSPDCQIRTLDDQDKIELEEISLEVIHVPGHTAGGIALLMKKPKANIVFTGDSLFFHGIGRTDFPGADGRLLVKSIKKNLFRLPDDTLVYPGHGPSSSIGEERQSNYFLTEDERID
jgi:glyoxylase-like metal-dependent hydrolase (beta-lactamase superfamily II)